MTTTNSNVDDLKCRLIESIEKTAKKEGLSQKGLAAELDTTQPRVSNMLNGQIDKFSLDTLFKYVYALDIEVNIHIGE